MTVMRIVAGPTVAVALRDAAVRLARHGIATPRLDAGLLLGDVLGLERAGLLAAAADRLASPEAARFETMLRQRLDGRPVSRILGRRAFWTLDLEVNEHVLDPRPDSETVIETVLASLPDRAAAVSILDLGTGSGCLLLALLDALPNARGTGVDMSHGAAGTARANARRNGLAGRSSFVVGDWHHAIAGRFDVVVANPPYIRKDELSSLPREVAAFDPRSALDGGLDGLDAYRALLVGLPDRLSAGALVALECGQGQHQAVGGMLAAAGLGPVETSCDLGGIERVVSARAVCGPAQKNIGMFVSSR